MADILGLQKQEEVVAPESANPPLESTTSEETPQAEGQQEKPEITEPEKKEPEVLFAWGGDVITTETVKDRLPALYMEKIQHQKRADDLYREYQELKRKTESVANPSMPKTIPEKDEPMTSEEFTEALVAGPGAPEFEKARQLILGQPGITQENLEAAIQKAVNLALSAQKQQIQTDSYIDMKTKFDTWQAQLHTQMANEKTPVPVDIQLAAQRVINANPDNRTLEDYKTNYEQYVKYLMQQRGIINPLKNVVKTNNKRTAAALNQQQIEGAAGTGVSITEETAITEVVKKLGSVERPDIL